MHSAIEDVNISAIVCSVENGKKNPKCTFLKSNMTAIVRIRCENYLSLEKYEENPVLGSFTLRDEGLTIAMGKVLRLKPIKRDLAIIAQKAEEAKVEEKKAEEQKVEPKMEKPRQEEEDDCPF